MRITVSTIMGRRIRDAAKLLVTLALKEAEAAQIIPHRSAAPRQIK
jgi:hypothetical protein